MDNSRIIAPIDSTIMKPEERNYENKQCKITKDQKRALVEFVTANFTYRRGLFKLKDDTQNKDDLWEQITTHLNSIGSQKTSLGWRKTCADLRMHLKKKLLENKDMTPEEIELAHFYGMKLGGNELNAVCYERLSSEQKARMIDLVCDNFVFNTSTSKLEPAAPESLTWDDISTDLNAMGACVKTTSGWKKCWSDIKCDVQKKFEGGVVPMRLTSNECQIAQLYNFNNFNQFNYQLTEFKGMEVEMVNDETVEEEHLDSVYVEHVEQTNHNTVYEEDEMEEDVDLLVEDPSQIEQKPTLLSFKKRIHEPIEPEPERKPQMYHVQEFLPQLRVATTDQRTQDVMEQLLEEQKRTNNLLEKLLEQQRVATAAQQDMLNELKNNSFFVMSNPNRNLS